MDIAVVGMLDEREEGLRLIMEHIERAGHRPTLLDISIGTGAIVPTLQPEVTCDEIARAGGTTIQNIHGMLARERDAATEMMAEGLGKKLLALHGSGRLQAVIAVGGMTGTFIGLSAMKQLPFGVAKLMITSVAAMPAYAKKLAEFFGVRDITVMHSVVDTVGMNPLVRRLMVNGAGAICGMAAAAGEISQKREKPSIALTEFGFCDKGAHYVREFLAKDFETVSFHATGIGEKAAVDLVGQGLFEAFIDMVPAGFSEHLLGGNRSAGPDRLDAGIRLGRAYILTPCGFDMISCGPIQRRDAADPLWTARRLADRKLLLQDAIRVQARTSAEEMQTIAREVAGKLNCSQNKKLVKFIVPTKGFSSLSVPGGALHDSESDRAFIDALKSHLDSEITIVEVDAHINTAEFARAVVGALYQALDKPL
jgi:uncharacterized protein (UPF0261 family)